MLSSRFLLEGSWLGEVDRRFCADVELGGISVWEAKETMAVDDFPIQKYVYCDEEGTKHRALGDTMD